MATDLETLTVRMEVDNSGLFIGLSQVEKSFNKHAKKIDTTMSTIDKRLEKTNQSFVNFSRNVTSTLAAGLGAREIIKASDSFINYDNRLKSVTKSVADYNKAQTETFRIAQETKQRLGDVISLYAGLEGSFSSAQKAAFPVLDITERLGKAFLVTGVQAQNSQAFILQLSQAAAADFKAVGQEINSLIENAPALTKAISEELGLKSASAIKKFAKDGNLNVNNFFEAFKRATDKMSEQADSMSITVEQSLTRLDNAFIKFIGQENTISGATGLLATGINKLADNFELLGGAATVIAGVMGGRLVSSVVATTVAFTANQITLYKTAASARLVAPAYLGIASSATAAAGATTLLSRSMAFFGGPIGIAITGLAIGYTLLGEEIDTAAEFQIIYDKEIKEAKDLHDKLTGKVNDNTNAYKELQANQLKQIETSLLLSKAKFEEARALTAAAIAAAGEQQKTLPSGGGVIAGAAFGAAAENAAKNERELEQSYLRQIGLYKDLQAIKKTGKTVTEENIKVEKEEVKLTKEQIKAAKEAEKAAKKAAEEAKKKREELIKNTLENERAAEQADMLAYANTKGSEAYEKLSRELDIKNKLQQQGFVSGTKLYKINEEYLRSVYKSTDAIEAQNKAEEERLKATEEYAEAMRRPIENALESIQDTISDTFVGVFDGSVKDAGDAADAIKKIFIRMAAEIATLELFGADGFNIAGSVRGGAINGKSASGFNVSDLTSFSGISKSLSSPLFSSKSTIGGGINDVGSYLGLGKNVASNFTIGSTLASVGGNFAGNLLLGNRGVGADIGGTIGGIAGTAIGGPIGGFVGSLAGNAIGGLFGSNRPKSVASNFGGTTNSQGGLNNEVIRTNGKGDPETAKALSQGVQEVAKALINSGIDVSGQIIQGGIDANKGFLGVGNTDYLTLRNGGGNAINFNPNGGEASVSQAMAELALQLAKTSEQGKQFADNLNKIETTGKKAEDVLNDINFILKFDDLTKTPQKFTELEVAVKEMTAQFDKAAKTADRLGLSVDKVREAEQKRMNELLGGITSDIASQILQITSPIEAQLQQERNRYAAQLRDLNTVGAKQSDIQLAELLHKLNIEKINGDIADIEKERLQTAQDLQKRYEGIQGTFKNILFDLTNGQYSPLKPTDNLASIRSQVMDLGNKSKLGDINAQESLAELLPKFVELSGSVNGFNASFEADRKIAEDLSRDTISVAERQASLQSMQLAATQQVASIAASGFSGLTDAIARLGGGVTAGSVISGAVGGSRFGSNPLLNQALANATGFTGIFNSNPNVDQFASFRAANSQFENIIQSVIRSQGFASGGLVGGIDGIDANLARLTKGEFVMNNAAVRSVGVSTMQAINNGGGDLIGEIKGLRSDMKQLTNAVVMTGKLNNDELQSISATNARIANLERAVAMRG
jgi:tape measure domain-containing protein